MISVIEFKKILNEYEVNLTEEQIIELRNFMYLMADLAINTNKISSLKKAILDNNK